MRKTNRQTAFIVPRIWLGITCFTILFLAIFGGFGNPNVLAQGDPSPFTAVGAMGSPRYRPTATLLGNGQVLVAGGFTGFDNGVLTNSAELFDPASETFTPASPMIAARNSATATLLPNGKVLIAGGNGLGPPGREYNYPSLNTAELYDPALGTFTALPNMTLDRVYHTATLLQNGKVLIAGGFSDTAFISNSAELFDPASNTFTPIASRLVLPRGYHTATLLQNGKVLLVGGYQGSGTETRADLYDPVSGVFTRTLPMAVSLYEHTATLLPDGRVLIAGGFEELTMGNATAAAQLYDPASGLFTPLPPMTSPRFTHSATLLPSGKVLLAGGFALWLFGPFVLTDTAELFDPELGTFASLLPDTMTSLRQDQMATLLPSSKILLAGGNKEGGSNCFLYDECPSGILETAELFDSATERTGFSEARRPVISSAPETLTQPASFVLTGTGFRGDSEASNGSFKGSATNYPLVQLTRIADEESFFVLSDPATNWSDTSFTSATLSNLAPGQYRVIVFTNAIPSLPKIIKIDQPAQLIAAVSRKTHGGAGSFDINLPLTGALGIESRSGGANGNHQIVLTFPVPVTFASAVVTTGAGNVFSTSGTGTAQVTINLTGVGDAQTITLTLSGVNDGTNTNDVVVPMCVLVGDTNADRVVNSADITETRSQSGQPAGPANFRTELNADGVVNSADITAVRRQSGSALP